jgi:hypothetical protein
MDVVANSPLLGHFLTHHHYTPSTSPPPPPQLLSPNTAHISPFTPVGRTLPPLTLTPPTRPLYSFHLSLAHIHVISLRSVDARGVFLGSLRSMQRLLLLRRTAGSPPQLCTAIELSYCVTPLVPFTLIPHRLISSTLLSFSSRPLGLVLVRSPLYTHSMLDLPLDSDGGC